MRRLVLRCTAGLGSALLAGGLLLGQPKGAAEASVDKVAGAPAYTADGRMLPPVDYRQWIFLTSGLDMSYSPRADGADDTFDNVFVSPASWQAFQKTGTWPDRTVFVLEFRNAASKVSINKAGRSQDGGPMGLEVHVKDAARGGWAFYEFDGDAPAKGAAAAAKVVPKDASCYTCHQSHAAVDTTFVQFYPTLLPVAKEKATLSDAYLKEEKK